MTTDPKLSIIIPIYNEEDAIGPLFEELAGVLSGLSIKSEVILVNDGSTDSSGQRLDALANRDNRVTVLHLRRNFGQSPAMQAGIDHAQGDIIVMMDGDRQNDPHDIPHLIEKLNEGFDIVCGWRRHRRDSWLTRKIPSSIANRIVSFVSGLDLHDVGCTLKAYRRDVLENITLYGDLHRFIPILGHWTGAKVTEVDVNHRARESGQSKYGISRTIRVLLDVLLLRLLGYYSTRPLHFFGPIGLLSIFAGTLCGSKVLFDILTDPEAKAHRDPFLLLAVFLFLSGMITVMIGLLAELIIRLYYEGQQKKIYIVGRVTEKKDNQAGFNSDHNKSGKE